MNQLIQWIQKVQKRLFQFLKTLTTYGIGLALIGGALLITFFMVATRPKIIKEEPEEKSTLVSTVEVIPQNYPVSLTGFGTVQGIRKLTLHSEVGGTVIKRSPNLIEGGLIKKGETLLEIDPRDYELLVEQEKAALARATFELQLEEGRQFVAEQEWELLEADLESSEKGRELALRRPHITEKKAALAAAKSRLEKAKLELDRTKLYAPFDAVVLEKNVEVGQRVTTQEGIATLVATDAFQVQVSLPYERLSWIDLPTDNRPSETPVIVTRRLGQGKQLKRKGKILRLLSDVDTRGRMARLLVSIPDPLGRENKALKDQPFLINTYVSVSIEGPTLKNVIVLPRSTLREGNRIWIMTPENTLEIRDIRIAWKTIDEILIDQGLKPGEEVITSPISIAIPGMQIRTLDKDLLDQ